MRSPNKSPEQLKTQLNLLRAITLSLGIILTLLISVVVYGLIVKPESKTVFLAILVVPMALLALIPVNIMNMNKLKKQIDEGNG